jgi:hypothetical protein
MKKNRTNGNPPLILRNTTRAAVYCDWFCFVISNQAQKQAKEVAVNVLSHYALI